MPQRRQHSSSSGGLPDWAGILLSLLSLLSFLLDFGGLARGGSRDGSTFHFGDLSRLPSPARPMVLLGLGRLDSWDGSFPTQFAWGVRVMMIVRVPSTFLKPISIPALRRNVAGRRNPRPSASALAGQFLDLSTFSPTTPSKVSRRFEAVPFHSLRDAMRAWMAVAT